MQVTTSKLSGCSAANASTLTSLKFRWVVCASNACSLATRNALVDRSMPVTVAPLRAMESDRMPPPQPTSSTRFDDRSAKPSIHSRRSGLIWCRGRNSLSGSHHRWANSENLANSAGSAFTDSLMAFIVHQASGEKSTDVKKAPKSGPFFEQSEDYLEARVPTTSISTRRFFARPSLVLLSATGCFSPLPSVYTRFFSMPLETR